MVRRALWRWSPAVVLAVGGTLFAASVAHHVTEVGRLDRLNGPMLALAPDTGRWR
ncbi:hypothetical protein [Halorussus salinisoli]|uniref:hypothetical protein n=1 Tax=Halorussus salinisoli TaxID=2558242 RepID=UPI0014855484|nr:hypothetical protein [Halorussus salinisoli]